MRLAEVPDRDPALPAGRARPRAGTKESEYLLQIREKQKARRIYGVLEQQFHSYYVRGQPASQQDRRRDHAPASSRAAWTTSSTGAGFAKSRDMARQLVRPRPLHGQRPEGRHPVLPGQRERHRRGHARVPRELTPFVIARAEAGERTVPRVARGHPEPDADPGALAARPGRSSTPRFRSSSSSSSTRSESAEQPSDRPRQKGPRRATLPPASRCHIAGVAERK